MANPDAKFEHLSTPDKRVTQIVVALRQDIVSGRLPPGQPLGQDSLARRFDVSRMPVREAIFQLENLGLVTVEPNKRARVSPVSVADFREIFDMRIAAEALALRRAIPELSNSMIDAAETLQIQIEAAPIGGFGSLNMAFHLALYSASHSPRLLAHIAMLGNAADRYQTMAIAGPDIRKASDAEHYELLAACRTRDRERAETCLVAHIERGRDFLAPFVT